MLEAGVFLCRSVNAENAGFRNEVLKAVLHLIEVAFKTGWISVINLNTVLM